MFRAYEIAVGTDFHKEKFFINETDFLKLQQQGFVDQFVKPTGSLSEKTTRILDNTIK